VARTGSDGARGRRAVFVGDSGRARLRGSRLHGSAYGVELDGAGAAECSGCALLDHTAAAVTVYPAAAAGREARLEIRDSVVKGAALAALVMIQICRASTLRLGLGDQKFDR
jgi:hypothetical protein